MTGALHLCNGEGAPLPQTKGSNGLAWVELLRNGISKARDGRVFKLMDPSAVIARSMGDKQELPIDYDHQMEREGNVGPVPAAGWIVELAERGGGIWGRVSWTPRGAELLANREYRFLSPSMMVTKNGVVTQIIGAGLVHRPALELKALASEEPQMSEEDDTNALTLDRAILAECLGLDVEKVTAAAVLNRLMARPDPGAFVPIDAVRELMSEHQAARNTLSQLEAKVRVETAMSQGHLTPAMKPWALELCQTDLASFEDFVSASPAPWKTLIEGSHLKHSSTADQPRYQGRTEAEAQKAICSQLGLTPEELYD